MTQPPEPAHDPDATLIARPSARRGLVRPALQNEAAIRGAEEKTLQLDASTGLNPLVAAANPLLTLVPQLRTTATYADPAGLRETLIRQLATFERVAREAGVQSELVAAARYALCTLVDESISFTPWGGAGQWARTSLLVTLFNETWGGEKFFLLLGKLAEDPAKNLQLLELLYVCLALGFEGRYRVIDGGRAQLEDVRERLYQMIRKQRGAAETGLSPNWRGVRAASGRGMRVLPLWVTASLATLVLAGTFIFMTIALNERSDAVFAMLVAMKAPAVRVPVQVQVAVAAAPTVELVRLKKLLATEIQKDQVRVEEDETTSLVTIRGDNLFQKGSAQIEAEYEPVIARVTQALNRVPGLVIVRGHTDNVPIHTARFPSNWHLSQERAASVARQMVQTLGDPKRIKVEGMADASPVVKNDTRENQARNRRVEILLKVAPQ